MANRVVKERWSDETQSRAIALLEDGRTVSQIARILSFSVAQVRLRIGHLYNAKYNLPNPWREEMRPIAFAMLDAKRSITEIAAALSVAQNIVYANAVREYRQLHPRSNLRWTKEIEAQGLALVRQNVPLAEIATRFGFSRKLVHLKLGDARRDFLRERARAGLPLEYQKRKNRTPAHRVEVAENMAEKQFA